MQGLNSCDEEEVFTKAAIFCQLKGTRYKSIKLFQNK